MTHKDFFRLFIKLLGLYLIFWFLLPTIIGIGNVLITFNDFQSLIFTLLSMIIPTLFFIFLVFKTDFIIEKLKLESGFDGEKIEFGNLNNENILKLSAIFIGAFMIIDNIPVLINHIFFLFKSNLPRVPDPQREYYTPKDYFSMGVSSVKIILGYFIMRNYTFVGRLIGVKKD